MRMVMSIDVIGWVKGGDMWGFNDVKSCGVIHSLMKQLKLQSRERWVIGLNGLKSIVHSVYGIDWSDVIASDSNNTHQDEMKSNGVSESQCVESEFNEMNQSQSDAANELHSSESLPIESHSNASHFNEESHSNGLPIESHSNESIESHSNEPIESHSSVMNAVEDSRESVNDITTMNGVIIAKSLTSKRRQNLLLCDDMIYRVCKDAGHAFDVTDHAPMNEHRYMNVILPNQHCPFFFEIGE